MRIISGTYKGKNIIAPAGLPVRPTTDFAKTGLFNILNHRVDFANTVLLDLFAGTGNISYEFLSRGCNDITCVDADANCVKFINQTLQQMHCVKSEVIKADVFRFLEMCHHQFSVIFADPPYEMKTYERLPELVFKNNLLQKDGLLIVEHASSNKINFEEYFLETRKYGHVAFSFFQNN